MVVGKKRRRARGGGGGGDSDEALRRDLKRVAEMAQRLGHGHLFANLINLLSILVSGRRDLMGIVSGLLLDTAKLAAEVPDRDGALDRIDALDRSDPVRKMLRDVCDEAQALRQTDMAAVFASLQSLNTVGRADLIRELAEVAASYSSVGVGKKPAKAVLVTDNDFDEVAGGEEGPGELPPA